MPTPRRDDYVLRDIETRLLATGYVDQVVRGAGPGEVPIPTDRSCVAWLRRERWTEGPAVAEYVHDRTVFYTLWVTVRGHEPAERFDTLVQVESAILNALNRVSLAEITMPSFTLIASGLDGAAGDSEVRVRLAGQFRYQLFDARTDHATDEP